MIEPQESTSVQFNDESPRDGASSSNGIAGLFSSKLKLLKKSKKSEDGYIEFGQYGDQGTSSRPLGTIAGVFSPVALSMFSALLFLRVGFIVGNAGLLVTFLQFGIAYAILLFTVSSICAISTNGAVEGGGAYFMISRTLGPDFGGSIGTLFFLANIVSSALYITGCTEGLVDNFGPSGYLEWAGHELPNGPWWRFMYCSVLNLVNLFVCLIGAAMFAKTSVAFFAIVCFTLATVVVSFLTTKPMMIPLPEINPLHVNFTGAEYAGFSWTNWTTLKANLYPDYSQDYTSKNAMTDFSIVFGVLFSGVTGIMAGANMSGELKDPGKSIPSGTIYAVFFTLGCYLIIAFLTAASCSRFLLINNYIYMMPINFEPWFITVGILTATFSASLSNLIGSSRVLEALAKDNIYGPLLSWVTAGTYKGNPIAAVVTSWFLVQAILFIGSLNTIAQINSVLFLLSYLATNIACLGLDLTSAPNFRPNFKFFTWHTALIGLLGTAVMMFVINYFYAVISSVLCILLVIILHLFSPASRSADWGSLSQALIFHQVRKYLLMLDPRKEHVKFWRPQMLLLVSNPRSCCPLVHFVNDLKKSGLYVLGHVIVSEKGFTEMERDPTLDQYRDWLSFVDHLKVKAFVELTVAKSVREGLHHLAHVSGIGAMKPNTIVLGFYDECEPTDFFRTSDYLTTAFEGEDGEHQRAFCLRRGERKIDEFEFTHLISDVLRMQKNLCICRHFHALNKSKISSKSSSYKYIDVWPVNVFQPSGDDPFDIISQFMLQLACIINMVQGWRSLEVRVHLCEGQAPVSDVTEFSSGQVSYIGFKNLIDRLRIKATIVKVEDWTRLKASLRGSNVYEESPTFSPDNYIANVNQMMVERSKEAAVSFVYLPNPPDVEPLRPEYLRLLTLLTNSLGPTVFVHGVSTVTSTTL